jgi:ferrous iron transport protein A
MFGWFDSSEGTAVLPAIGNDTISLTKAKSGHRYKIIGINGGGEVQTRLASLGIIPGQCIRVLQPGRFGPAMVAVKGAKLALGRGVSAKILIRPASA